MFLLFNSEEVYFGHSLDELLKVRECLAMAKIKYTYKVNSHSGRYRGSFGNSGLNLNNEKEYYIYVKRNEFKKAKYLVDKTLNRI